MTRSQSESTCKLRGFVDLNFCATPGDGGNSDARTSERVRPILALDRVEEFYHSLGVPCEIVLSPLADPSLRDLLAPRGYRITEFNSVLIRPLEGCVLVGSADGITVGRVTADSQQTWDRVIARAFAEYGPLPENLFCGTQDLTQAWARDHVGGGNCCAVGIGDSF